MYGLETYLDFDATWSTFSTGEHEDNIGGVRTWKLLDDLDRYQLAIERSQPEVVVEVGTKWGGSALWFASQPGVQRVITVDIDPEPSRELRFGRHFGWTAQQRVKIDFITGNSTDLAVFSQVRELVGNRRCLVSLDGEHAAPHVADEIAMYGHLVRPDQYLVVEDGIFDLAGPERSHLGGACIPAEGGPLRAISWCLAHNPMWTRAVELERMTDRSYHPAGIWRRGRLDG